MSRCVSFIVLFILCLPVISAAGEFKSNFSGEISTGVGYSDRLRVAKTRPTIYKSDISQLVNASLEYDVRFQRKTDINLSYDFSQREYEEITTSNSRYHYSLLDVRHKFSPIYIGTSYSFLDFRFGGKQLLEVGKTGAYAEGFVYKDLFLNAGFIYSENVYDNRDRLYSESYSREIELTYYLNRETYFIFDYQFKDERAKLISRRYDANKYKLLLVRKIKLGKHNSTLEISWRTEDRSYETITRFIGKHRNDVRRRYKLLWNIPVTKMLFAEIQIERANYESNVPWADYVRDTSSANIGIEF